MSRALLQKYRAEILDLTTPYGMRNVRVFGSLARGKIATIATSTCS